MSEPTLRERRANIKVLRATAERFLAQATQVTMKRQIREVLLGLTDVAAKLRHEPLTLNAAVSIDLSIRIAVLRLLAIGCALERDGQDAPSAWPGS